MPFPSRVIGFQGPSGQRGAISLMAAITLGLALLLMVVVVDTGRLYLEQRKLQRIADGSALEAVSRAGNCLAGLSAASYATQSASRNAFSVGNGNTLTTTCGTLVTGANNLRTFAVDATQSSAIRVVASHSVQTSVAAGIYALVSPGTFSPNTQLTATAVAAAPLPPVAQLSIRSTIANVNLLNSVMGPLLGGSINLTAAGWNGLLNTDINLLSYLNQLAIDLNVTAGNYTQLLSTNTSVTQLISTAITVSQANGASADVLTALGGLKVAAQTAGSIQLGSFLNLSTITPTSQLNANLQLFQLVQAIVEVANNQNGLAVNLPASLLGLGVGATVQTKVIEGPQFSAIGNPALAALNPQGPSGIYVRTAQIRTLVSLDLSLVSNLLSVVSGLLSAGTNLLGLTLHVLPDPTLDISLEAGGGSSYVTGYTCVSETNKSLSISATTDTAYLRVGNVNSDWASNTGPLTVTPFTLVSIGTATAPFAAGGASLMISSPALQTTGTYTFINPPDVNVTPTPAYPPYTLSMSDPIASLTQSVNGIQLTTYTPTYTAPTLLSVVFATLTATLNSVFSLLTSTLSGLLSPLLDNLINTLLAGLGITVGQISVDGHLTCGQPGKAYLVI
ncbi:pilus assembly protein TadG-related protein [Pseudomonas sp. MWU13-2100]|uniref:pilus assembly protein TadG-related protein n=1 Tax=Pseudomonas sp. MWU13-2100 TaxID=2935075 RepID=UPI00200F1C22|nr:pilus assembly protein TadG-related protein [Pseudomonas sp. MWU13-2100]